MRYWLLVALLLMGISTPLPQRGVNEMLAWYTSPDLDRTFSLMNEAGIQWVRVNFAWKDVQRDPGAFDFTRLDTIVKIANEHHIQLLPILLDTPEWASSASQSLKDQFGDAAPVDRYRAQRLANWMQYVCEMVSRYPDLPFWEVWNEENLDGYWPPSASPREYLTLLKATYQIIKAVNPNAKVVLGGLANAGYTPDGHDYLQTLYDLGAAQYFDVVSIHVYSSPANGLGPVLKMVSGVRALMDMSGDWKKPLWLTEIGWSDTADPSVNQHDTAAFLQQVYSGLLPVDLIFWYNFRDLDTTSADPENRFGLVNTDFTLKPVFSAYKAIAR